MTTTKTKSRAAPWNKPNPKKKSTKLSPAQKASAKSAAKKAGRKYPNLIDNMRVAARGRRKAPAK